MTALTFDISHFTHRNAYVAKSLEERGEKTFSSELITGMVLKSVLKSHVLFQPQISVALFDSEGVPDRGKGKRQAILPDYKAHREKDESIEEYRQQAEDRLQTLLQELGVVTLKVPGFEADDLSYYMKETFSEGVHVTEDKDWSLNINENWKIYRPIQESYLTLDDLKEKYQDDENPIHRELISKAIVGDDSDNIKGVHGVGEKSAVQMSESILYQKDLGPTKKAQKVRDSQQTVARNMTIMSAHEVMKFKNEVASYLLDSVGKVEQKIKNQFEWLTLCGMLSCEDFSDQWESWSTYVYPCNKREYFEVVSQ